MSAIQLRNHGDCLEIHGDMTSAEVPDLLSALKGCGCVTHVDLTKVGRVDSSALAVLLACSRSAGGATVTVRHAPPSLRALSDLYGLQTLFWVV